MKRSLPPLRSHDVSPSVDQLDSGRAPATGAMSQPPESLPRRPTRSGQTAQYTHAHYLMIGLVLGGLWILNRDKSLLFHAVQMLVVMSLFTGVQIMLRRRAREALPYPRLVVPKLVLVALAVGAEWLLASVTSRSNAIVAVGLVVLVTAVGPVLDRVAARRATAASQLGHASSHLPDLGMSAEAGPPSDVPQ